MPWFECKLDEKHRPHYMDLLVQVDSFDTLQFTEMTLKKQQVVQHQRNLFTQSFKVVPAEVAKKRSNLVLPMLIFLLMLLLDIQLLMQRWLPLLLLLLLLVVVRCLASDTDTILIDARTRPPLPLPPLPLPTRALSKNTNGTTYYCRWRWIDRIY